MRNTKLLLIGVMSLTLLSAMCSSDDDENPNTTAAQIEAVEDDAESGTWRITYFYDTDHEETSDYNGYDFTFNDNGTLVATNGTNTYNGTWSVTNDSNSSSGDSSSSDDDDLDFNIFFASPEDFEELSDDWDIISHSSTSIQLIDVSGGNGGTDYLTFTKNN